MPYPTGSFRVVVGVDGSAASDAAVRWANGERVLRDIPLTLVNVTLVNAITPAVAPTRDRRLQLRIDRWQKYQALRAPLTTRAGFSWRAWVTQTPPT